MKDWHNFVDLSAPTWVILLSLGFIIFAMIASFWMNR